MAITGRNNVPFYLGSVLDKDFVASAFDEFGPDAVCHFAALKAVGESVSEPVAYIETNIGGLTNLLDVMKSRKVHKLVFSSSATIYGEPDTLPVMEDAPRVYTNPYAFTKLASEQILEQTAEADPAWAFGILRYFNPVGAHPSAMIGEDPKDIPNNLVPYIQRVATGELEELTIFGKDYKTPDGTGIRDYLHVMDLADGHVLSMDALFKTGEGHVVNLGTGQGHSVLEVVNAYARAVGKPIAHRFADRRPGDIAACYADVTKARDLLGFEAKRDLDSMCQSSWDWAQVAHKRRASDPT